MKSRWTLILGVGLLILLAACNSTPATSVATEQAPAPANPTQGVADSRLELSWNNRLL